MKKLFGGINLTWKKLIIFSVVIALYTAIMAIIPYDTSFKDISVYLDIWIFIGIIIISNCKSPLDSALKCFVFFLISQPLIYLFQVPFSYMGFGLFKYYKYWIIWTFLTFPMGFIGYYIKKKNILSILILLPMLFLVAYQGIYYFDKVIENFPYHLLSGILCYVMIIIVVFNIFDKIKYKLLLFLLIIASLITYILIFRAGASKFEVIRNLSEYNLDYSNELYVSFFSGTANGDVTINKYEDSYTLKLEGVTGGTYTVTLTDDIKEYNFRYYFDKKLKTVVLEKID